MFNHPPAAVILLGLLAFVPSIPLIGDDLPTKPSTGKSLRSLK